MTLLIRFITELKENEKYRCLWLEKNNYKFKSLYISTIKIVSEPKCYNCQQVLNDIIN